MAGVVVGEESTRKSAPSDEVVGALAAGSDGGLEDVEEGADGEEESGEGRGSGGGGAGAAGVESGEGRGGGVVGRGSAWVDLVARERG